MRAHNIVQPDRAQAGGAQLRAQVDVDLSGDHHLHDVERGGVGDAATADDVGLEAELLRERGRLRAAAVRDHDAAAAVDERAQIGGQRRHLGAADDLAAELDDDGAGCGRGYGHEPGSSSVSFSSTPSITFMLWMAWPAPPLIKLSLTEKQVTRRLPVPGSSSSPTANPTST